MVAISLRIAHEGRILRSYAFEKETVRIGRDPDTDVFLSDPRISRIHTRLERDGGRYYVSDNGSTNGTHLNDKRVDRAELETGDAIRIGDFTLWVEVHPDATPDPEQLDTSIDAPTLPLDRPAEPDG